MKTHSKARILVFAVLAVVFLSAFKAEDVMNKLGALFGNKPPAQAQTQTQAAPVKPVEIDPAVAAIFSGRQPLEFGAGQKADYTSFSFPRKYWGKDITVKAALFLPPRKDNVPVMVIMHGSGGLKAHEIEYARVFLDMGIGVLLMDSFTPRGVTTTFENQGLVSPRSLSLDATTALVFLSSFPRVDMKNVGIIGFSKGGIAAHYTALRSIVRAEPLRGRYSFKMHIVMYPGCAAQSYDLRTTGAPIYMLLGEADTTITPKACQLYAEKLKTAGANIYVKTYPGARHAWDAPTATNDPNAENFSNCLFEQQKDKTWTERTSGVTGIVDLEGARYQQALKGCLTRGSDKKYDAQIAAQSLADIKALAQKDLLTVQPLLVPKAEAPPPVPAKPEPKKKKRSR